MPEAGMFPLLQQAHEAVLKLEDITFPAMTSSRALTKSAPASDAVAQTPRPPVTALIKKRARSCHKQSLVKEQEEPSRIRVDSARLFEKLAEILPPPNELSTSSEKYDEELHTSVMSAVASCTVRKDAPQLAYFIRKEYSSSAKGKDIGNKLIIPKPPPPPPLLDDPGFRFHLISS
jgi:hypothetical protein